MEGKCGVFTCCEEQVGLCNGGKSYLLPLVLGRSYFGDSVQEEEEKRVFAS